MNDTSLMRLVDTLENLSRNVHRPRNAKGFVQTHDLIERCPINILHDEIKMISVDPGIDELNGVGMNEVFNDVRFEEKTLYRGSITL